MKHTIQGFSQKHLIALGLGGDEAMILRWFVDFQDTGRMRAFIQDGRVYYWVSYSAVLEDLPIIGGSVKTMSRRFDKLVTFGVLERIVINEGRPISCFRIVESAYAPLVGDSISLDRIVQPKTELSSENPDKCVQPETELSSDWTDLSSDLLTKPDKTPPRDINISLTPPGEAPVSQLLFDRFWEAYPRKKAKGDAEKAWKKLSPDSKLFDSIMAAVSVQRQGADWTKDGGKFIPYPATWLRAKGWLDEIPSGPPPPSEKPSQRKLADEDEWATYIGRVRQ